MQLHSRRQLAAESIFSVMSRLAAQHGAVNLGQGFPAAAPPDFLLEAARAAVGTVDQYTAPTGLPALREAVAADLNVNPEEVVITCGATEALHTLADALYGVGDEVLMFEPVFDVYRPQAALSGAAAVLAPMTLEAGGWRPDLDALQALISPRTRAILLNSPHNPTGYVFGRAELEQVAALARQHDLWLISDEVYDELYYGPAPVSLRTLAPERTFTVGSAGKRLDATGWRIGWIAAPPGLASELAGLHQWASFCAPAPLQAAVAAALPVARQTGFYAQLRDGYAQRMRLLAAGLRSLGLTVYEPGGTYFITALTPGLDPLALVRRGVAVIPGSAFYARSVAPAGLIRLAFCKPQADIERALERLAAFLTS
ncbi:pyridoxal phosphate-dependent aminotransferase [Deinococcus sp.]|uniref:pyridoxal phosphate-dependent aminotransferase n=1 Tax=Deinococcus sp. TaxID=47478 RepID=UPI003CC51B77